MTNHTTTNAFLYRDASKLDDSSDNVMFFAMTSLDKQQQLSVWNMYNTQIHQFNENRNQITRALKTVNQHMNQKNTFFLSYCSRKPILKEPGDADELENQDIEMVGIFATSSTSSLLQVLCVSENTRFVDGNDDENSGDSNKNKA
jgi:hypothetical protein